MKRKTKDILLALAALGALKEVFAKVFIFLYFIFMLITLVYVL